MADFSVHENALIQKAESMKKVADKSCRDSDLETAYFNYRAASYTMLEVFKTCPSSLKDGIKESKTNGPKQNKCKTTARSQ